MVFELSGQMLLSGRTSQGGDPGALLTSFNANIFVCRAALPMGWTQTYSLHESHIWCILQPTERQTPPNPLNYLKHLIRRHESHLVS